MRTVASNRNMKKKKRKISSAAGQSQEKRRQQSRSRDPLLGASEENGAADANEVVGDDDADYNDDSVDQKEEVERVYTNSESLGHSTSGRKKWQMQHHKGKFSKRNSKKENGFKPMKGWK